MGETLLVLFHSLNVDLNTCTCARTHKHTPHDVKAERGLFVGRKGPSMGGRAVMGANMSKAQRCMSMKL